MPLKLKNELSYQILTCFYQILSPWPVNCQIHNCRCCMFVLSIILCLRRIMTAMWGETAGFFFKASVIHTGIQRKKNSDILSTIFHFISSPSCGMYTVILAQINKPQRGKINSFCFQDILRMEFMEFIQKERPTGTFREGNEIKEC